PVMYADLGDDAKRGSLYRLAAHCKCSDPGEYLCAEQAGKWAVGYYQPERPVGRVQQPSSDRNALFLVRIEQRHVRSTIDDQRKLPSQIVGILQSGVHALCADRAVDVCRVAEQEASVVAESRGTPVLDAVGGEPSARVEGQSGSRFPAHGGNYVLESHLRPN